jgi:hydroxyethylthiazole kinase-like uncharacterized protein yjeF
MRIVTANEMRALDKETIEQLGIPGVVLMESAGRGVVEVVARLFDGGVAGMAIVVVAGPGNNGGDGFVIARHLYHRGAVVTVLLCAAASRVRGDAAVHLHACQASGVKVLEIETAPDLRDALAATAQAEVVVDALLGTGLTRPPEGLFADAIRAMNEHGGLRVAVDVPSGLSSDSGQPLGVAVKAHHTVTFGFCKVGLASSPGFTYAGELHVHDIGIPESLAWRFGVRAELLEESILTALKHPRDPLAHKGTAGHILVVAGSRGKCGAALLSGTAALRTGAGLVTLAIPAGAQHSIDARVPELMTTTYRDPEEQPLPGSVPPDLRPLLEGKKAVAIGPGVPTTPVMANTIAALCEAASTAKVPLVLDADALNHLARSPSLFPAFAGRATILTPHPGEAARLLDCHTTDIQADRVAAARELAARFAAVAVLKGARTVVAAPDGRLAICPTGNPGLATAGTGDVLTGILGALIGEMGEPYLAACHAVFVHGAAGDRARERLGERALVAHDVIDELATVLSPTHAADKLAEFRSRRLSK